MLQAVRMSAEEPHLGVFRELLHCVRNQFASELQ
jgi:hypothetical protein